MTAVGFPFLCPYCESQCHRVQLQDYRFDAAYLLSAGLDGSGGCRARSHFTLLCLCSKLQQDNDNNDDRAAKNCTFKLNIFNII